MKLYKTILPMAVIAMTNSASGSADDQHKEVTDIYDRVQELIAKNYPQATFERKDGNFRAKYNTRTFMIHHPLKTGEWQEARPQEGPNRKGIQCSISPSKGPWAGAAMVPQTFDYRYFESWLMAPYNEKLNTTLVSHLDYPDDATPQFRTSYNEIVSSFATKKSR